MALYTAAKFMHNCIQSNVAGSIASLEIKDAPHLYAQFYICGNENDQVNGEIYAQIAGPENTAIFDPAIQQRFARFLETGWSLDDGNASRKFGPFSGLDQVMILVQTSAQILTEVYGIENPQWDLDCYTDRR
jgi:hypothetical protein